MAPTLDEECGEKMIIVAAIDNNLGIGYRGNLPWRSLPDDMYKFRGETKKNRFVIVGKRTFISLPNHGFLPNREVVLVSSTWKGGSISPSPNHNIHVVRTLDEAAEYTRGLGSVIGGSRLYADAIMHPDCTGMFLTRVHKSFDVDTFFPGDFEIYFKLSRVEGEMMSKLTHLDGRIDNAPITFERWVRKSY